MLQCKSCLEFKTTESFYARSGQAGVQSVCKSCTIVNNRERRRKNKVRPLVESLPGEEWRGVIGFNEYYKVSSLGRIKSLERWIIDTNGFSKWRKEMLLKGTPNEDGYLKYGLFKDDKVFTVLGNQIVGKAFIVNPMPDVYFQTNHKNGIRHDNRAENLEWCDSEYNNNYKYDVMGYVHPSGEKHGLSKEVIVTYPDGKEERIIGILETSRRLGFGVSSIKRCLAGSKDSFEGHKFRYFEQQKQTA